jgi:hypothetical protein
VRGAFGVAAWGPYADVRGRSHDRGGVKRVKLGCFLRDEECGIVP